MNRDFYNIIVCFADDSPSDALTSYRFCIPPRVGDEVYGEAYIYKIAKVIHSEGSGLGEPEVRVMLETIGEIEP